MSKDRHALLGILEAINAIELYTTGFTSAEEFFSKKVNFDATMMNFVLIGEMVDRVSDEIKSLHSSINWPKIKSLRNIIAHDYFGVDAEEIWQIVLKHIPILKKEITSIIKSMPTFPK